MTLRSLVALLRKEYLEWIRNPFWIIVSLLAPILYLVLFGQAFNLGKLVPPGAPGAGYVSAALLGAPDYFSYFSVGMVGFVVLTSSLFAGTGVIFAKQLGTLQRTLETPVRRSTIFASILIFRGLLVVVPAFLVLGLAILLVHVPNLAGLSVTQNVGAGGAAEVVVAIVVLALAFTSLFLAFGFVFEKVESYFGLVNLLNLPILFTSNALYPKGTSPLWLQNITAYNPVSLAVNVLREVFFGSAEYGYGPLVYLGGLLLWATGLIAIALLLAYRALRPK